MCLSSKVFFVLRDWTIAKSVIHLTLSGHVIFPVYFPDIFFIFISSLQEWIQRYPRRSTFHHLEYFNLFSPDQRFWVRVKCHLIYYHKTFRIRYKPIPSFSLKLMNWFISFPFFFFFLQSLITSVFSNQLATTLNICTCISFKTLLQRSDYWVIAADVVHTLSRVDISLTIELNEEKSFLKTIYSVATGADIKTVLRSNFPDMITPSPSRTLDITLNLSIGLILTGFE